MAAVPGRAMGDAADDAHVAHPASSDDLRESTLSCPPVAGALTVGDSRLSSIMGQCPPGEPRYVNFGEGELAAGLRPYVMPPNRLPAEVANGAPVILPGLVVATVVCRGNQVDYLPTWSILELGGRQVWARAIENVRNLDEVQVIRELDIVGRDDTELVTMRANDPFVASRVTVLDWLVEQLYAAPAPNGVLVAVPRRTQLVLHVPTGIGVLKVVETMATVAKHWFETAEEEQISPDVYFASHDEGVQRVTIQGETKTMIDMVTGPFAKLLQRLIPGFQA